MYPAYESVLCRVEDRVATVTINRPQMNNALDPVAYVDIRDVFQRLSTDSEVGAVILTGAGRNFSAGGDIQRFRREIDAGRYLQSENIILTGEMSAAIRRCAKPTIAMVNGAAAGAGCGLALACDFRILASHSKLILSFINLGLTGDSCSMYYLARMVGTAKAIEFAMLGKPIRAQSALELGIAYKVTAAEDLESETYEFAKWIAHRPTSALSRQKQQLNDFFYNDLDSFMLHEAKNMTQSSRSDDFNEAVNAFLEKRDPKFTGV